MHLDWWTLALQTVNFLVLVWLLQHFLYKPVTEVIARRRAATNAVLEEAEAAQHAAERLQAELTQERAGIAAACEAALAEAHKAADVERAALLQRATTEAQQTTDAARAEAARLRKQVETAIENEAGALAVAIVRRLSENHKPTLEALCDSLRAAPPPEGPVLCALAAPLTPSEEARWRQQLGEALGRTEITFVIDPALLEGAELRFPHAMLRRSRADDLVRIAEELARERT